jgi:hypothetical protein
MIKITNVVAALGVSLTLSSVAIASVITTGTLEYDNVSNVITDNVTGVTYLGWDMVKDLDYAQTVAITTGAATYGEYHIASQAEAYGFFNAATGLSVSDEQGAQDIRASAYYGGDGRPFGHSGDAEYDDAFFLSAEEKQEVGKLYYGTGYWAEVTGLRLQDTVYGERIDNTDYYSDNGTRWGDSSDRARSGWLLVRPSANSVPEPSIIALLALGLVGIGFARRRQS